MLENSKLAFIQRSSLAVSLPRRGVPGVLRESYLESPVGWQACRAAGRASSSSTRTVRTPARRTVTSIVRKNRLGSRCRMRYLDRSASTTSRHVVWNVMPSVLYSMSGRRQRAYTFTVVVCNTRKRDSGVSGGSLQGRNATRKRAAISALEPGSTKH